MNFVFTGTIRTMSVYQKYFKYLPAVFFIAVGLPETLEHLETWKLWIAMLQKWPRLNYMFFGAGMVMLIAFLISDIKTHKKTKPTPDPEEKENQAEWDLLLMEKLTREQLLNVERERSTQKFELEKDRREKLMTYCLLMVILILALALIHSC